MIEIGTSGTRIVLHAMEFSLHAWRGIPDWPISAVVLHSTEVNGETRLGTKRYHTC